MHIPKNSSICFIGDSITAAEKFVRMITDYFVLNYPEKHLTFHNVGIPGGAATEALNNWEKLVTSRGITHAVVMFGMNDLNRVLYADSARVTEELLQKRDAALEKYKVNVKEIDKRLMGIPHFFMTPTPHDEYAEIESPLYSGYDVALTKASAFLKEAFENVLDLHTLLTEANEKRLVKTIIGPDRVHPGNIGHALIAKNILKHLGFEDLRLPLWDDTITDEEKAVMAQLGIMENPAPKNPYSDERKITSRKVIDFYYMEMNVLAGIDKNDSEKVETHLKEQIAMLPEDDGRLLNYRDYLENRHTLPEREKAALEAMEKMYTV